MRVRNTSVINEDRWDAQFGTDVVRRASNRGRVGDIALEILYIGA
jgi:hypothetical protein